ncbi:alpha/beta fold hydrolase [Allostreptomyces psammosilenae]|uniref:Pimeloyl-ACP methyl ester carboxylesterase n=1 Tax=Allostreptomyces psammosilenae TaxID=1892865 RepID=A0A853A124_9ACTN|nr:alpha/beta hydrolase [Allostreptomyces psammosilenae]NYI04202.1 pimeloyl-ACP methyl ester carboxylesterase [Allostreptomyces psammosilenae]
MTIPPARRVAVNGVTLDVVDAGSGPAVLLLHGFPDRAAMWSHQIETLTAAGYRVVAPDLRGFGDSDRPAEVDAYRMPVVLGDVTGLLDALELPTATVVGHDWGAVVTWSLTMAAPDRVERLAALSVGHPAAFAAAGARQRQLSWYMLWFCFPGAAEKALPEDDWRWLRQWAHDGVPDDDPVLTRHLADLARPGALTAGLNWYRANVDPVRYVQAGPSGPLPPIGCPVLGVWSDGDMALTEEQMTGSREFVQGPWRYERLEGVGHWFPEHAAERLSALLLDWLKDS